LLEGGEGFNLQYFSSDGGLFAAAHKDDIFHVWKYISSHYAHWRTTLILDQIYIGHFSFQFSPTSPSILGRFNSILQVHHLDDLPIPDNYDDALRSQAVLSPCGTYMVTVHRGESAVAITNLLSQVTPQFIDLDMEIYTLALTGNVLSIASPNGITAWRLTNEGLVDGVFGDQRASLDDNIWMVPESRAPFPMFTLKKGQTVTIGNLGVNVVHAYHSVTGEVFEPSLFEPPLDGTHQYSHWSMSNGEHYLYYHSLDGWTPSEGDWPVSMDTLQQGWVKDLEGKHRLWMPIEWRIMKNRPAGWFSNIKVLWFNPMCGAVIIMLQPHPLQV